MINQFPYSIRVFLELAAKSFNRGLITDKQFESLKNWSPQCSSPIEIPFLPARIILQDSTGVPLLTDLAAMRDHAAELGLDLSLIEPKIPVDFIIDHSLQTNHTNVPGAAALNSQLEFSRNHERYKFIKWGGKSFNKVNVFPPGMGIVHQINLELISKGVLCHENEFYPDTVIGTDSHTTMVNGLGIVGWGVGGLEAEAAMLGLPIYLENSKIVGVKLLGAPRYGVTATDIVLNITKRLRDENVVGSIVEYFGEGAKSLSVQDRCTIANMAPDYGATMGLFYLDEKTLNYYMETGRDKEHVDNIKKFYQSKGWFDIDGNTIAYSRIIEIDLSLIKRCVAGPKLPSQCIELGRVRESIAKIPFNQLPKDCLIQHGDILIAAITSCTNTANPDLMIAAGLLAKKAVQRGLSVGARIKTSMTPGSRAVTAYLNKLGLQKYLDELGFYHSGYGCATCAGNVGCLDETLEMNITKYDVTACSVLSGNRNFEARIHPKIAANYLMSPALVVAFAIVGNIDIDLESEPLGLDQQQKPVFLCDIYPSYSEMNEALKTVKNPSLYKDAYQLGSKAGLTLWDKLPGNKSSQFEWDKNSTYITKPPFFLIPKVILEDTLSARALVILGDSITTDHISPAGIILPDSIAGKYLQEKNVLPKNFNSYAARRGNHEVMVRGAFSNPLLKNRMVTKKGGYTVHFPSQETLSIYEVAEKYQSEKTPVVIFAGSEYGSGSSRDWAAKATRLLGVKLVIAESFERIHKSNLIGMGVLPCSLPKDCSLSSLSLKGNETFDILNIKQAIENNEKLTLIIHYDNNSRKKVGLGVCLNTKAETAYFKAGGLLPHLFNYFVEQSVETRKIQIN